MTSIVATDGTPPIRIGSFTRRILLAAVLVPTADFFFFDHALGLSVPLFLALLAFCVALAAGRRALRAETVFGALLLSIAVLPAIEDLGFFAMAFALAGMIVFSLLLSGRFPRSPGDRVKSFLRLLLVGGFGGGIWLGCDLYFVAAWRRRKPRLPSRLGPYLLTWLVPLTLCAVFAALFSAANPLIDGWLARLDIAALLPDVDVNRILFWFVALWLIWPFLRPKLRRWVHPPTVAPAVAPAEIGAVFGPTAILQSLVLFNALFAVESVLDLLYLWSGSALPRGFTFAAYAHRGAYPLVVTALLAGAFLLLATRRGSASARSRPIRILILLWVAQNLLLLASSVLRLDLYVAVYSLTTLRLAAFIWMGLTAVGLVLIILRMLLDRSNGWLVLANAVALALLLYTSALVDFSDFIARYNVRHRLDMQANGVNLDLDYLRSLGSGVLPAMDDFIANVDWDRREACKIRQQLLDGFYHTEAGWRGWSFRRWRLARYFSGTAPEAADAICSRFP